MSKRNNNKYGFWNPKKKDYYRKPWYGNNRFKKPEGKYAYLRCYGNTIKQIERGILKKAIVCFPEEIVKPGEKLSLLLVNGIHIGDVICQSITKIEIMIQDDTLSFWYTEKNKLLNHKEVEEIAKILNFSDVKDMKEYFQIFKIPFSGFLISWEKFKLNPVIELARSESADYIIKNT